MDNILKRLEQLPNEIKFYTLRHLPLHLLNAGQDKRFYELFTNPSFIRVIVNVIPPVDLMKYLYRAKELASDNNLIDEWFNPLEKAIETGIRTSIENHLEKGNAFNNSKSKYYSCFISYNHADEKFATKLYNILRLQGIRCWLDKQEILPGDDLYDEIDKGIQLWDKVLVCCSEQSLGMSIWVEREIDKALQKEEKLQKIRGKKILALIPLDLDGYLFKWDNGKASILKSRLVADFNNWQNNNKKFLNQLERLINALRLDNKGKEPPPTPKL